VRGEKKREVTAFGIVLKKVVLQLYKLGCVLTEPVKDKVK
jgi:hypothetical protein